MAISNLHISVTKVITTRISSKWLLNTFFFFFFVTKLCCEGKLHSDNLYVLLQSNYIRSLVPGLISFNGACSFLKATLHKAQNLLVSRILEVGEVLPCLIAFDLEFTEIWHQTESSLSNQEGKKKKKSVQLKIYDLPFNETEQMKFKYTSVKRLERIFLGCRS